MVSDNKICARCKVNKPLTAFSIRKNGRPLPRCKECHNLTQREKYQEDLDHIVNRRQKLRITNTDIELNRRLKQKNLTKDLWESMLAEQNSKCNGCGRLLPVDFYEIDHINGLGNDNSLVNLQLLCGTCNSIKHSNSMDYLYWHLIINGIPKIPLQQLPEDHISKSVKIIKSISAKQKQYIKTYNNRKWRYIHKKYNITKDEWYILLALQRDLCNGCGRLLPTDLLTVDHIIPAHKEGECHINNYQLLCRKCNLIKGNRDMSYLVKYRSVNSPSAVPYQEY